MHRYLPAIFALLLLLPGCAGLSSSGAGGHSPAAGLGPDGPTTAETSAAIPSTLPRRMEAAASDLWAWYDGLKAKVDPAIEPMRRLYVAAQEVVVSVQGKDWLRALGYATTAWGLVHEIQGVIK